MDLKKVPPPLLVALGLAGCGPAVETGSTDGSSESQSESQSGPMTDSGPPDPSSPPDPTVPPDPTIPPEVTSGCLEPPIFTSSDDGGTVSGPCLSFIDPETSACLSIFPTTGTDTGTGTGTGTDTDTGTTSGGNGDAPPPDRGALLERLEHSGVLPPDLLKRLRSPR